MPYLRGRRPVVCGDEVLWRK
jgi:hypothetical protein